MKEEIVEIANRHLVDVVFIASYAHMKTELGQEKWRFVDSSKEAVDLFIMNHVKAGDLVITQDIGLASTLLLKGVKVLSPRGNLFEEKNISIALDLRYLSAKARRRGEYGKGPKPFTKDDRNKFITALIKILSEFEGIR